MYTCWRSFASTANDWWLTDMRNGRKLSDASKDVKWSRWESTLKISSVQVGCAWENILCFNESIPQRRLSSAKYWRTGVDNLTGSCSSVASCVKKNREPRSNSRDDFGCKWTWKSMKRSKTVHDWTQTYGQSENGWHVRRYRGDSYVTGER